MDLLEQDRARGESSVRAPPLHLPPAYLAGFAASPSPGEREPHVWAFRAAIGEWKRWPIARPPGDDRHFNDADAATLGGLAPLWEELQGLAPRVAPLLGAGLAAERPLGAEERAAFARWLALVGVRSARRGGDLPAGEAFVGVAALEAAFREMGWVLWVAEPPHYFIGSSSPLHAAFPRGDESRLAAGFDVTAPQVEVTFALSPRVALHATWRRRGELWRRAREEVALEINGRTCATASTFLFSPEPAVPG